jgi:hypothetical protein
MNYSPCDWRDKRRQAPAEIETKAKHAIHIRSKSRRAVLDRAEGTSAREPGAVSRKSVLRARGSVDTQAPVRGYFLWVGGALLVLLFAANSLLPAPPPRKLIESHSRLPRIRIASELRGPEAVVIDTSQVGFLPMLPGKEIAVPHRSVPMWPMLCDSRPRHCPSMPMRVTGAPQSRPISVKRWRS